MSDTTNTDTTEENTYKNLPKYAVVKNRGKGRVLEYHGRGYFTVLLKGDVKAYVPRSRCTFTNR